MFKKGIFFILTILAFFLTTKNSLAVDTCDSNQCDPDSDKYQECLTDVRDFCSKQKSTLSNEIKLLESKYQLTLAKKTKTENDIKSKETEIEKRKNSISLLEKEINIDSGKYIIQINESYKLQKKFPSFIYLLTNNFNDFLSQHHYISLLQENTKNILINNEKKTLSSRFGKNSIRKRTIRT